MDLMLLRAFQQQILLQCQFMLMASAKINEALRQDDISRTFYSIQNLLNAAANVSKALWGQSGSLTAERQALRDSIGVSDSSPLREVTMRNNFEHFDERLDRWWTQSAHHNYADLNIGPRSAISGIDNVDTFRMYDPATTEVVFWGQSCMARQGGPP